jgi:hypothetical protein
MSSAVETSLLLVFLIVRDSSTSLGMTKDAIGPGISSHPFGQHALKTRPRFFPSRRRSSQRPSRRAISRQRHQQSALRISLGRSIQSLVRSRNRSGIPRRNSPSRRRQDRAFLLDVWTALLLDENHGRRPQVRSRAGNHRRSCTQRRTETKGNRVHEGWLQDLRESVNVVASAVLNGKFR